MPPILSLVGCLAVITTALAQVPATDLYLFQLTGEQGKWHLHSARFLSAFNPMGYTNQPEFVSDDELYVSVRMSDSSQNDIYSLDISSGILTQVTSTPENEYSPTLCPDKQHFTCVRQVEGEPVDQRVFKYPIDRKSEVLPLPTGHHDVGYHCWLADDKLALFLVDEPPVLAISNLSTGKSRSVSSKIGRCLRTLPDGKLAYVHKYTETYWYLKKLEPESTESEIIVQTPEGSEDFAIDKEGNIFMGSGSRLLVLGYQDGTATWVEVADLSIYGVSAITRLAINNRGTIAIVSNRSE